MWGKNMCGERQTWIIGRHLSTVIPRGPKLISSQKLVGLSALMRIYRQCSALHGAHLYGEERPFPSYLWRPPSDVFLTGGQRNPHLFISRRRCWNRQRNPTIHRFLGDRPTQIETPIISGGEIHGSSSTVARRRVANKSATFLRPSCVFCVVSVVASYVEPISPLL